MKIIRNFLTTVRDKPCIVCVTEYKHYPGSYSMSAESDLDYYGYTDVEYDLQTVEGKPFPELEAELTFADQAQIEHEIEENCRED